MIDIFMEDFLMKFILASQSPRRKELLKLAGINFITIPSNKEEIIDPLLSPENQVKALALMKAKHIATDYPDSCVLGSDTIVVLNGKILGKPANTEEAISMLKSLRANDHQVMTAVAIVYNDKQIEEVFINVTTVKFYDLPDEWIIEYVESGAPMDKAGSYGIQDAGFELVEKIDGDYYSVMGLPISQLKIKLRQLNLIK